MSNSRRSRAAVSPAVESLEGRELMSLAVPANTIGIESGDVSAPRQVAAVPVEIPASSLTQGRSSTMYGITVGPLPGSTLAPRITGVIGANGKALPVHLGAPFTPNHGQAFAYVPVSQPGPLTVLVAGNKETTGTFNVLVTLPGNINGTGSVNITDVQSFPPAYTSNINTAYYKPSADANRNGYIGIGDAKFLERNLPLPGPEKPLLLQIGLGDHEQVYPPQGSNSGGETYHSEVTIQGRTTPGSMLFLGFQFGHLTFSNAAISTNAQGRFQFQQELPIGITEDSILVISPYGQKLIRIFPIVRIPT